MSWQEALDSITEPCELFFHNLEMLVVKYSDGELQSLQLEENNAVAARVIKERRVGFSMGNTQMEPKQLIDTAIKNAEYGKEAHFEFPSHQESVENYNIDSEIEQFDQDAFIEFAKKLGKRLQKDKPTYQNQVQAGKSTESVAIKTNTKNNQRAKSNGFGANFSIEKTSEGDIISVGQGFHEVPSDDKIEEKLTETYYFSELCENVVSMEGGQFPVLIHPLAFTFLLEPLYAGLSAKSVFDGLSPIQDKIGEQLLSEKFTLYDDPFHQNLTKFGHFDDEGVPLQTKKIFDQGRLTQYLSNLEYATRLGLEPSGNGFRKSWLTGSRQLDVTPSVSPTNRILEAGGDDWQDMLAGIDDGVMLVMSADCWIGNIINGDFSGTIDLGFKIEKGKLVGRVKNMRLSGNIYSMFGEKLDSLSSLRRKTYHGHDLFPYVLCKDINIS